MAQPIHPRDKRDRCSACSGVAWCSVTNRWPIISFERGVRDMLWQRERIVGSTAPSFPASNRNITCGGGSSKVFNNALAASSLMDSAPSRITTLVDPSYGFRLTRRSASFISFMPIIVRAERLSSPWPGATTLTSAWWPSAILVHWVHVPQGTPCPFRQFKACARFRASVILPTWGGPHSR